MTKAELQKSIEMSTGTSFPDCGQVAKAINRSRDYTRTLLLYTKCWQEGRRKLYFSGDVADALKEKFQ